MLIAGCVACSDTSECISFSGHGPWRALPALQVLGGLFLDELNASACCTSQQPGSWIDLHYFRVGGHATYHCDRFCMLFQMI